MPRFSRKDAPDPSVWSQEEIAGGSIDIKSAHQKAALTSQTIRIVKTNRLRPEAVTQHKFLEGTLYPLAKVRNFWLAANLLLT